MTPLTSISTTMTGAAGHPSGATSGRSFSSILDSTIDAAGDARRGDEARVAAQKLISSAMIMPILSSLRESPFLQEGPLAPGIGEQRFMPMLDQLLADRIAESEQFTLDELIARRLVGESTSLRFGDET